jgi:uncharacterized membrane protein
MTIVLQALRLLAIIVWVGGLIFFAFVLAPTAFHVLPTQHEAGTVVGATLHVLNEIGHICGFVFVFASLPLWYRMSPRSRRLLMVEIPLIVLMVIATMYVQSGIIPAMERDRVAAGGAIDNVPPANPARAEFDRLHSLSEKVEGSALFLGLAVALLLAAEDGTRRARITAEHPMRRATDFTPE